MISELLNETMSRYPHARDFEEFKSNSLGNVVRNELPASLRNSNALCDTYIVKGSVGQGGWAVVPWIAIMDSRITTTTQNGVYIVYLFAEDGSAVYLTLNQGCTDLIKRVGRGVACDSLSRMADDLRKSLIIPDGFLTTNDFIIGNKFYEIGCIAYKRYEHDAVPSDEVLLNDLLVLCTVYTNYYMLLGYSNTETLSMNINATQRETDDRNTDAFSAWLKKKKFSDAQIESCLAALSFVSDYCIDRYQSVSIFAIDSGDILAALKKHMVEDDSFRALNKEHRNELFMAFDQYHSYICKSVKENAKHAAKLRNKGIEFVISEEPTCQDKGVFLPEHGKDIAAEDIGRLLDFAHPERCMGCDPVQCVVEGKIIEGRTWRDILITLLEKFLANERSNVRELYRNNLLPGSKRPTLLKEKPEGSCRQLSNGYWVYMNFSIPVLVELIGRLCKRCGVAISDVHITYQDKAGKRAPMVTKASDNSQTYKEIIKVIKNDYANGFVFSSTSLRLLSEKAGCEVTEKMQEQMKRLLFERNDEVYYIIDVIATKSERDALVSRAKYALEKIGYYEINELYEANRNSLNNGIIRDLADFEDFYSFLDGENVRCVKKHGFRIARLRDKSIDELFGAAADKAYEIAHNEYGGVITIDDLLDAFPLCSTQLIDYILKTYSEMFVRTEINDVMCFQTIDALGLTEDFSQQLVETLDHMGALEIPPSDSILHAILSTKMNVNFKKEYGIPDDKVFRRLISLYYKASPSREWKAGLFTEVTD